MKAGYPGKLSHKIILPLLAERGEGRGEESRFPLSRKVSSNHSTLLCSQVVVPEFGEMLDADFPNLSQAGISILQQLFEWS